MSNLDTAFFEFFINTNMIKHTCKNGVEGFEITDLGKLVHNFLDAFPRNPGKLVN